MRTLVWSVLCVGLAIRVYLILGAPYNEREQLGRLSAYNDEPAHVSYTLHILETGRLPGAGEPITRSLHTVRPTFENYQSPLYYVLHAAACRVLNATSGRPVVLVGRFLSLLFMACIVWTAHGIARQSQMTEQQWCAAIIVLALSGVFVRFSALAGNEAMAWLMAGLVVLTILRLQARFDTRPLYAMAIFYVLGIYTKLTLAILSPLVVLALFSAAQVNRRAAVTAAAFILVGTAPLMFYNSAIFGSPIPLAAGFGVPEWRVPSADTLLYLVRSSVFPWSEFWQSWLGLLVMLPTIGLLAWFAFRYIMLRSQLWCNVLILSSVLAYVWLNTRYNQAEGRYLFIAWPALFPVIAMSNVDRSRVGLIAVAFTLPYLLFVL